MEDLEKFVCFTNPGELDPRAFTAFGVNVKMSDSAIGYFGTGLKYALAILLREGCELICFAGETRYDFGLKNSTFRDKEFQFVGMRKDNGPWVELGFTTELGKNWEPWGAYRELACNCTDEEGFVWLSEEKLAYGKEGQTTFIVTGAAIQTAYTMRHEIFLTSLALTRLTGLEIHRAGATSSTSSAFYKGVRVATLPKPSLYTYNALKSITLTEDRTLLEEWNFRGLIARQLLTEVLDERILQNVLLAPSTHYEHSLDFHGWGSSPSPIFLSTVDSLVKDKLTSINPTAVRAWREATNQLLLPDVIQLSTVQEEMLTRAVAFCERFGFFPKQYKLCFVEALGEGTLGLAHEGKIYISERVFHQGTKQLAATLIEEYVHLKHGYHDCTRELQTYLFDRLVSLGEELQGSPL